MGLNRFGRAINSTGAMRCYRDGSTIGFVWRTWHPLAWILGPIMFLAYGLISGFPEAWRYRHDIGFGMKPWFKEHPERLEWL